MSIGITSNHHLFNDNTVYHMAKWDLNYTLGKVDTVQSGLDVVKSRVDKVDHRVSDMEGDWRGFDTRLNYLENDLRSKRDDLQHIHQRDEKHSAKLRALEERVSSLTAENDALREKFVDMRLGDMKDRLYNVRSQLPQQDYYTPRDEYYQRNPDNYRRQPDYSPRYPEQQRPMYYEQNRMMQQKQNPWNSKTDDEKSLHGQAKKDYDRIELHDGNFKPWTVRRYENPTNKATVHHGSGVYMLIRTQMGGLDEVRKALIKREHILKQQSSGHVKGIATSASIFLLEPDDEGDWRMQSHSSKETDNCVLVLWFPTIDVAYNWIVYDGDFSKSNFPEQYGCEIFIVPAMKNPLDDRSATTFLMTEFPGVRDFPAFRERFGEWQENLVSRFEGHANVVFNERSKHVRGKWVSPNNPIVIHRFKHPKDAMAFYKDPECAYMRDTLLQSGLVRGRPRSVLFTLVEFL